MRWSRRMKRGMRRRRWNRGGKKKGRKGKAEVTGYESEIKV